MQYIVTIYWAMIIDSITLILTLNKSADIVKRLFKIIQSRMEQSIINKVFAANGDRTGFPVFLSTHHMKRSIFLNYNYTLLFPFGVFHYELFYPSQL